MHCPYSPWDLSVRMGATHIAGVRYYGRLASRARRRGAIVTLPRIPSLAYGGATGQNAGP
jgi:hypothetical protein